ncbi:hypothetical protein ONS95_000510 [Cadophora gregata]|uniref:uncharacterized protein n=1 Tax=Cadophora gregata TaxID=51156 RepID=UPI0026DAF72B|nr:uncharacterized protein ONS95_000510 [Cadophora gregata]KAK0125482.1 hypothetical protein ONS96_009320 [Cadophora gregata f. sp. sojae]KAK0128543.1 hypothetical protein ONS95_000510 [Cadophora gregata]
MSEISGLPPSETSPDKALPLPHPRPPRLPPPIRNFRAWLPLYLSKTDRTLARLSQILSTPTGTDTVLLTICYTSLLTSNILTSISLSRLRAKALSVIEKAISLPPNTALYISTSNIPPSKLLIISARLKALSSLISDVRIFARLWGLLGLYSWGKQVWNQDRGDEVVRGIAAIQVVSNILYQYLENMAYLSSKGIWGWSSEKQSKAWVWSSRFWALHVMLDLVRLGRERTEQRKMVKWKGREEEAERAEAEFWKRWKRQLLINMAYAPLTIHWSLEKGLVGQFWVGLFGSVAGLAKLKEAWRLSGIN